MNEEQPVLPESQPSDDSQTSLLNDATASTVLDFVAKVERLGLQIKSAQIEQMVRFCELIADYSKHTNLVGNSDLGVLLNDHVLDSLTLVSFLKKSISDTQAKKPFHLLDFGTGAGFPAVVLAIACPEIYVTMIEAVGKKCRFLDQACAELGLAKRTKIFNDRAEDLAHDVQFRNRFDFATARAVANFDITAEVILPFLRVGGVFLAQKSYSQVAEEEIRAKNCLPKLGGVLTSTDLFDEQILGKQRALLLAAKVSPTKGLYPRLWGKIKSNPLGDSKD